MAATTDTVVLSPDEQRAARKSALCAKGFAFAGPDCAFTAEMLKRYSPSELRDMLSGRAELPEDAIAAAVELER